MKVLLENIKEIQDEIILITNRLNSGRSVTLESKLNKDGDMKDFQVLLKIVLSQIFFPNI